MKPKNEESTKEMGVRPIALGEYVGQDHLRSNLQHAIDGAKARHEPIDHMLLYGPPGLGKTSLAGIVAHEMGGPLVLTAASALQQARSLINYLRDLEPYTAMFIDEIHRLPAKVEEILYPAMEDGQLTTTVGSGVYAQPWTEELPPFSVIGATTHLSRVSEPLRDRFGLTYRLDYYTLPELRGIVDRAVRVRGLTIREDACAAVAARSKGTARIADRLVRRVRDYATGSSIGLPTVMECMADLGIDALGLTKVDRTLLHSIVDKYEGGPVGLVTLADETGEDQDTIQDVYEPYLMRIGYLVRTPRGRIVSPIARQYLAAERVPASGGTAH